MAQSHLTFKGQVKDSQILKAFISVKEQSRVMLQLNTNRKSMWSHNDHI